MYSVFTAYEMLSYYKNSFPTIFRFTAFNPPPLDLLSTSLECITCVAKLHPKQVSLVSKDVLGIRIQFQPAKTTVSMQNLERIFMLYQNIQQKCLV